MKSEKFQNKKIVIKIHDVSLLALSSTSSYPFNPERKYVQKWCFCAHFQFFCSHRKQISCIKKVISCLRSSLSICRLNFENPSIGPKDISKKPFSRRNRKQILSDNIFPSSLRSNLNICRLNFENPSISSQDISKKSFPAETESRFSAATFLYHHFDQT